MASRTIASYTVKHPGNNKQQRPPGHSYHQWQHLCSTPHTPSSVSSRTPQLPLSSASSFTDLQSAFHGHSSTPYSLAASICSSLDLVHSQSSSLPRQGNSSPPSSPSSRSRPHSRGSSASLTGSTISHPGSSWGHPNLLRGTCFEYPPPPPPPPQQPHHQQRQQQPQQQQLNIKSKQRQSEHLGFHALKSISAGSTSAAATDTSTDATAAAAAAAAAAGALHPRSQREQGHKLLPYALPYQPPPLPRPPTLPSLPPSNPSNVLLQQQ
eukprot:497216-Pelagomonas_calceolata.AAC.2